MSEKIKFAIIGCGHIGMRHAEMVKINNNCELVALVDSKENQEILNENFECVFFNSIEALLSSEIPVDVINIATPNGLHYQQAVLAIDAGKHVVIEKPLALNKQHAASLISLAQKHNVHLFPVMQNRYSPPSVWLKEKVTSGKLGAIYNVQVNCFWNRDDRYYKPESWHGKKDMDGGTLFTQFSHFIDMIYWLFGDVENIQGKFANFNHQYLKDFEDSGFINFDFVNGGIGTFNYSTSVWDKNLESSLTIIAENGTVKIGGQYMNKVETCHIKNYHFSELPEANSDIQFGIYKGSAINHHYVIQNVLDVLKNNTSPFVNAYDAYKVVDIIERIYSLKK